MPSPSFVGLISEGPWVIGGLARNLWSYAGRSERSEVNQFLLQPFLNHTLPDGWSLTTSAVMTADRNRSEGKWTVPWGGGIGRITRFGSLPVNIQPQISDNLVTTDAVGDWTIRFQVQLLFPKLRMPTRAHSGMPRFRSSLSGTSIVSAPMVTSRWRCSPHRWRSATRGGSSVMTWRLGAATDSTGNSLTAAN